MEQAAIEKAKKIKVLLLDVDGVLTDGRIIYDSYGKEMKFFDVHDGLGVALLRKMGIRTILVTAKGSRALKPRARDMQVKAVFENVSPKTKILKKVLRKFRVTCAELCFVGDDLVDLCLMKRVGFPVAVNNAVAEIKKAASYVTSRPGGRGAVREVAELILKSQDKWEGALKHYDT
ncbi:MAG: HAD-IIIA family hydrolase [Candidatus Omnitrophota bacterium]|jgi:3-deoxy-D-manno-octulosonate 8-phosphate phosphatase (KDO 8-P phosphatase)